MKKKVQLSRRLVNNHLPNNPIVLPVRKIASNENVNDKNVKYRNVNERSCHQ